MKEISNTEYEDHSLNEWIQLHCNELEIDAVGLWQLIPTLRRRFGLSGDILTETVRSVIRRYIELGASPVIGDDILKNGTWIVQKKYGIDPEEISNSIVDEWLLSGKDPDVSGIWFAKKQIYEWDGSIKKN